MQQAGEKGCPFAGTSSILGFATDETAFLTSTGSEKTDEKDKPTHYGSYLQVETLLNLQLGQAYAKPDNHQGLVHHEELTFILVHQIQELWFKLVITDLTKVRQDLTEAWKCEEHELVNRISQSVHYMRRTETILHHLQGVFHILETMHPGDFVEFRDYLLPASGFQSVSFRQLEILMGVPDETRPKVNGQLVFKYLDEAEQEKCKEAKKKQSLNEVLVDLLCHINVPESFVAKYLETAKQVLSDQQYVIARAKKGDAKAESIIKQGVDNIASILKEPENWSEGLFLSSDAEVQRYRKAFIAALFVISYRHDAQFCAIADLLDQIIAVEEAFLLWRGRHVHMAERMIGRRTGSGGSSGVGYLDLTSRHRVFQCLWLVRKCFIRSSALPPTSSYGKFSVFPETK